MKRRKSYAPLHVYCVIVLFWTSFCFAQSDGWPLINFDMGRTSCVSGENILYPPLQNTCKFKSTSGAMSNFTIYGDLLCLSVNGSPNSVEAIDMKSGDSLWTFKVPGTGGSMSFACAQNDSFVFAGGQHGNGLYALDRKTGEVKWENLLGSLFTRNVILDGEYIYVFGVDSLYCLHVANGVALWARAPGVQATPAVDDKYVYALGKNKIRIFSKLTGELVWEKANSHRFSPPISVDDRCFYTTSNDTVFAFDSESRTIKWFYHASGATIQVHSTNIFALSDSVFCFAIRDNGEGNGQLVALDKSTGDFLWQHTFAGVSVYTPVIANDVVYVIPLSEKSVYGFDLNSGEEVFYDSGSYRYQPAVVDHKLFVSSSYSVWVFENAETAVHETAAGSPGKFNLDQNYPNPFNPETTISFTLSTAEFVRLTVYDVLGRELQCLVNERMSPGQHQIQFNADNLPGGLYFYRLDAGSFSCTKKLLLIR